MPAGDDAHMTMVRAALSDAPVIFVVGKGGTGKTTTAAALALEFADDGIDSHIISTDPAHSLHDVFGTVARARAGAGTAAAAPGRESSTAVTPSSCSAHLWIEEFDAAAYAAGWLAHAAAPVTEIVERGTYLDADDVTGFTRLALPGLDELMAVLRLADLRETGRTLVVDTAPTGHTLRLLDAAATHEGMARALRAMADKAAAVASGFAGRAVRLGGEQIIDELERYVHRFRADVLQRAAFVVVARADAVVMAETARLTAALEQRGLRIAATVFTGGAAGAGAGVIARVPLLDSATGCDGLRAWRAALVAGADGAATDAAANSPAGAATGRSGDAAMAWLQPQSPRLLLFAGKGGVGKSTCAAAVAVTLAETRAVLLCSADPAGSLDDVFGERVTGAVAALPRLRVLQIDAAQQLAKLREAYRADVMAALETIGLTSAAALDRRVIDALWDLSPPGIDEFAALAALLDAAAQAETIVLDAAPTGHFLRLLTMPQIALDWTRQLMRILVKYHAAGAAGGAAAALLQSARELRALQEVLRDGAQTGVFIVTLDQPVVMAETARLAGALRDAGVPVSAVIRNRAQGTPADDVTARGLLRSGAAMIIAPEQRSGPVGPAALREFSRAWNIVT